MKLPFHLDNIYLIIENLKTINSFITDIKKIRGNVICDFYNLYLLSYKLWLFILFLVDKDIFYSKGNLNNK